MPPGLWLLGSDARYERRLLKPAFRGRVLGRSLPEPFCSRGSDSLLRIVPWGHLSPTFTLSLAATTSRPSDWRLALSEAETLEAYDFNEWKADCMLSQPRSLSHSVIVHTYLPPACLPACMPAYLPTYPPS